MIASLLVAGPSFAADEEGEALWYVDYQVGVSFTSDVNINVNGKSDIDPGYMLGGAFGRRILDRFRVEIQLSYNDAQVDSIGVRGGPGDGRGGVSLFAAMANAYYDLDRDLDLDLGFTPWIGFGMGWGEVDIRARSDVGPMQLEISDTDSVFAYNVMAGATVPVTDIVQLDFRYRYLATADLDMKGRIGTTAARFDAEYEAHQAVVGMRVVF